jgi:DNA-binding response OmpR family regulator
MKILCIEDEEAIAEIVQMTLERVGYAVEIAESGTSGLERAMEGGWALIVLDGMLPGLDGLEVCRRLRLRRDRTPILMLTARDTLSDELQGLDMGADDYLTKPFAIERLVARVRALLRREVVMKTGTLQLRDLTIDLRHKHLSRGGLEIHLSRREWAIFEALLQNESRPMSREALTTKIWHDEAAIGSNVLDVYINTLRRKIDDDAEHKLIRTIYGIGYSLVRPPE